MQKKFIRIIWITAVVLATIAGSISFYYYFKKLIPHIQSLLTVSFGAGLILSIIYISVLRKRTKYIKNKEESKKAISNLIKEVIAGVKKGKKFTIYEANLQTTPPDDVLQEDIDLASAIGNSGMVNWYMIFLENKDKLKWFAKWLKEIKQRNEETKKSVKVYQIKGYDIANFPLLNLFVIPELKVAFIGFGDYWGERRVNGGGILIKDEETVIELQNLILNWCDNKISKKLTEGEIEKIIKNVLKEGIVNDSFG